MLALENQALLTELDVDVSAMTYRADELRTKGASVMHLAVDGRLAGILSVSDPIKEATPEALARLHEAGVRIAMATGDGVRTANAVGKRLNIDEVHGEVRPADKLALVERLQHDGVSSACLFQGSDHQQTPRTAKHHTVEMKRGAIDIHQRAARGPEGT